MILKMLLLSIVVLMFLLSLAIILDLMLRIINKTAREELTLVKEEKLQGVVISVKTQESSTIPLAMGAMNPMIFSLAVMTKALKKKWKKVEIKVDNRIISINVDSDKEISQDQKLNLLRSYYNVKIKLTLFEMCILGTLKKEIFENSVDYSIID